MLSLNSALQLTDIQLVADFSDSSDSKNGKNFSYVYDIGYEDAVEIKMGYNLEGKGKILIFAALKYKNYEEARNSGTDSGDNASCHS